MSRPKIITMTGYYRVSTKAEAQETSFKNQPKYFHTLLKDPKYKNYRPTKKFYCDWGLSGTKLNRPGFKEMLEDAGLDVEIEDRDDIPHPKYPDKIMKQRIYKVAVNPKKKPKFEEIWIKTTSRFARNINAYEILMTLRNAGVFVYFISKDLSTRNLEDMPAIRQCLSEDMSYSEQLSRDGKIKQQQFEEEGRLAGCPFGYDYHKKTKKNLPYYTINPEEAIVVRKIFEYCINGLGSKEISKKLAQEGYLTKTKKPFAVSTIKRILDNEKYMGLNTIGKHTTGELFQKLTSVKIREDYKDRLAENEGLPAIVSKETWYAAKEATASRRNNAHNNTDPNRGIFKPTHKYKDILVCGFCGNHFIFDNNGGRGFYKCSTKRNKGKDACPCNNVFQYKLDAFLDDLQKGGLFELIQTDFENTITSLIRLVEDYMGILKDPQKLQETDSTVSSLLKDLSIKQNAREQLLNLLTTGQLSDSGILRFQEKIQEIEFEIQVIEEKIQQLKTPYSDYTDSIEDLFSAIFAELKLFENKKRTYTKEEVYDALTHIKVYGETKDYRGGRPPQTVLIPILKETLLSQALIQKGFATFTYKIHNSFSNYDPDNPIDWDTDRRTENTQIIKYKYLIPTHAYLRPNGDLGYIKNFGFEDDSILDQIKDHIHTLYNEFNELKNQSTDNEKDCVE